MEKYSKSSNSELNSKYKRLIIINQETGFKSDYLWDQEFTDKFPSFVCQICLCFVSNPVACSTCETLFCFLCLKEYSKFGGSCPNRCNLVIKPINRVLKNLINEVKIKCLFRYKGCKENLYYDIYLDHINECEFGPHICLAPNCFSLDTKSKIITHSKFCENFNILEDIDGSSNINSEFRKLNSTCPFCKENLKIDNESLILIHKYLCESQIIICKSCDTKMTLREFRKHDTGNNFNCLKNQYENRINYLQERLSYNENLISTLKSELSKLEAYNNFSGLKINNCINIHILNSKINVKNEEIIEKSFLSKNESIDIKSDLDNFSENFGSLKVYSKSNKIIKRNNQTNYVIKFNKYLGIFSIGDKQLDFYHVENLNKINSQNFDKLDTDKIKITYLTYLEILLDGRLDKFVILGTDDCNIIIYTINDEFYLTRFQEIKTNFFINFIGHYQSALSESENVFLIVGGTYTNAIIYNFNNGQKVAELSHRNKSITAYSHLKSLNILITCTKDSSIRVWKENIDSEKKYFFIFKEFLKEHTDCIWALTSIENKSQKKFIASGSGDRKIILWEIESKKSKMLKIFSGHKDSVTCLKSLEFLEKNILISGSYDGEIKIWEFDLINIENKNIYSIFCHQDKINSISFYFKCKKKSTNTDSDLLLVTDSEDSSIFLNTLIIKLP